MNRSMHLPPPTHFWYYAQRKASSNLASGNKVCKHYYHCQLLVEDVFSPNWHFTTLPTSAIVNTGVFRKIYIQWGTERWHKHIFVVAVHCAAYFHVLDLILARTCTAEFELLSYYETSKLLVVHVHKSRTPSPL